MKIRRIAMVAALAGVALVGVSSLAQAHDGDGGRGRGRPGYSSSRGYDGYGRGYTGYRHGYAYRPHSYGYVYRAPRPYVPYVPYGYGGHYTNSYYGYGYGYVAPAPPPPVYRHRYDSRPHFSITVGW